MKKDDRRRKVLVIDDNEDLLLATQGLLESRGYLVLTATSGKEGLRLFRMHQPDLLITDMFMPEMSGAEVIRNVLRDHPNQKIIAVSGHDDRATRIESLEAAMQFGATRFLQKPVEPAIFLETVQRSLVRPNRPPPAA